MLWVILAPALLLGSAQSSPAVAPAESAAQRITGLPGISNAALVAPGLYRGGAPSREGITSLSKLGVRTIVNLRHFHTKAEAANAEAVGIRYLWLPIPSSGEPSADTLGRFLAVVQDPASQPVYVHCYRGKDRTGTMIAAYRILVQRWSRKEALAEMREFGFFDGWVRLRKWVERLEEKPR
ncbi:MAG: tyrosine-protein phosphatase [Vicinamibacteria bacterium]|nr:tyrosine-protein phosphatase [Vicinamibacteria bacterium]